jgi:F-type H+-transporting ATPase subunit b
MSHTIMQLGTLLVLAIPTVALFAAVWIKCLVLHWNSDNARQLGEETRGRLAAVESALRSLHSKVVAIEAMVDLEAVEKRVRATVEAEKRKIVEAAEREIAAAMSSANPDFRAYTTDMAVALAANGVRVDGWTDEALLRSLIDQLGSRGSN